MATLKRAYTRKIIIISICFFALSNMCFSQKPFTKDNIKLLTLMSPTYSLGDLPHITFKDFTTQKEEEYECDWNLSAIREIITKCENYDGCPALKGQFYAAVLNLKLLDQKEYDVFSGEMKSTGKKEKRWVIILLDKMKKPYQATVADEQHILDFLNGYDPEKVAAEQARLDSLKADSIAYVEAAAAAEQQRINDSAFAEQAKTSVQNNLTNKKKLIDKDECNFQVPCGARPWYLTLKFIKNTNNVFSSTTFQSGVNYYEDKSNGTFTVDKTDNYFIYITCKFKSDEIYKLKYSIKKKKWILLNSCDTAPEVESSD